MPLFIGAVMVSQSRDGEKHGGEGDGGRILHGDYSGGELADSGI